MVPFCIHVKGNREGTLLAKGCLLVCLVWISARKGGGGDSSLETFMMCMGDYEIETPITKYLIEKKCMHINSKLENGFMYLY